MKRRFGSIFTIFLVAAMLVSLAACKKNPPVANEGAVFVTKLESFWTGFGSGYISFEYLDEAAEDDPFELSGNVFYVMAKSSSDDNYSVYLPGTWELEQDGDVYGTLTLTPYWIDGESATILDGATNGQPKTYEPSSGKYTIKVNIPSTNGVNFVFDPVNDKLEEGETGEKTVTSIAITTQPTKTEYKVGEMFSTIGMVVTATLSDDSQIPVTDYTISKTGALDLTDTSITITYEGKSVDITITVIEEASDPLPLVLTEVLYGINVEVRILSRGVLEVWIPAQPDASTPIPEALLELEAIWSFEDGIFAIYSEDQTPDGTPRIEVDLEEETGLITIHYQYDTRQGLYMEMVYSLSPDTLQAAINATSNPLPFVITEVFYGINVEVRILSEGVLEVWIPAQPDASTPIPEALLELEATWTFEDGVFVVNCEDETPDGKPRIEVDLEVEPGFVTLIYQYDTRQGLFMEIVYIFAPDALQAAIDATLN